MDSNIQIAFLGDFAIRHRFVDLINSESQTPIFGDLQRIIQNVDYSVINLEAPIIESGKPIKKSGPNIKSPLSTPIYLRKAGIDLLCLANNHIMDFGTEGLKSTTDLLRKEHLKFIGVGRNEIEAQEFHIAEIKGKRIAIINIAENEFGNATMNSAGAAPLNPVRNFNQICKAKAEADYTIIVVHGGHETFEYPSMRMRDTYRFFIDAGADAVIGHHTHCFSGYEEYNGKPIIYSLGNCIFDNGSKNRTSWNYGVCALLSFSDTSVHTELTMFSQSLPEDGYLVPKFLSDGDQLKFRIAVTEKEKIIKDDQLLMAEFKKFVEKSALKYKLYLEPTSNKYLLGLISHGIISSLRDERKTRLLTNIIRCEAHRDILLSILTSEK